MTVSVQVAVAQAITDELNRTDDADRGQLHFSMPFTAYRQHGEIDIPLKEDYNLRVDVVPYSMMASLDCKAYMSYKCVTTLCVRQLFPRNKADPVDGSIPLDWTDKLFDLLQELLDYFAVNPDRLLRLDTALGDYIEEAAWLPEGHEIHGPYARYLKELRQFVGIVRVCHEVHRDAV